MKKTLVTIISTLMLSACGTDVVQGPQGLQGPQGPQGDSAPVAEESPSFVGEFYFPYSGFVITTVNHEDEYSVDVNLQSLNNDGSICNLDLDSALIDLHDGKILYNGVIALTAGNCRSDAGAALLTTVAITYQYEVTLSFDANESLQARLRVFQISTGVRTQVIDRTLAEE